MNLVLVLIVGSILVLWLYFKFISDKLNNLSGESGDYLGVLIGVLLLFGSIFIWQSYFNPHLETKEEHYFYMQSLGNDKYLEGDFTLGSGSIDEIDYYFFYGNTTRGMSRIKVPANKTYLIEGDIDRPKVVKVIRYYDDKDLFFKNLAEPNGSYDPYYYKMYVPEGTIVKEFKVR